MELNKYTFPVIAAILFAFSVYLLIRIGDDRKEIKSAQEIGINILKQKEDEIETQKKEIAIEIKMYQTAIDSLQIAYLKTKKAIGVNNAYYDKKIKQLQSIKSVRVTNAISDSILRANGITR